jgi:hypothetical protein
MRRSWNLYEECGPATKAKRFEEPTERPIEQGDNKSTLVVPSMPLYFAYGSNMDREAMRLRCPQSRALGRARLARHRFFIMSSGHASVKRVQRMDVHGVLYDLAFGDIAALDRYEETGRGLYQKISQSVLREGAAPARALLYVGASGQEGAARGGNLDCMIAAARAWEFPEPYITYLLSLAGGAAANAGVNCGGRRAIRLKGV